MATFIATIKFTQQGIKGIDDSTKRAAVLKAAAKKMGAKVTNVYWTLGEYDGLLILEAPNDETAMTVLLHLAALGNVHTTTVRAFTAAEISAASSMLSVVCVTTASLSVWPGATRATSFTSSTKWIPPSSWPIVPSTSGCPLWPIMMNS